MERITIRTDPPYEVLAGYGLLDEAGERTAEAVKGRRVLLATDENVAPLYLERARKSYEAAGFRCSAFVFPAGESHKTLGTVERLLEAADEAGLTRSDLFAALGGGLVGDLTGLAAALYLRGIDFVQLPTTLLAMADASVGGKTAVNLPGGKNLCGAFHQPKLVLCDGNTLRTLPGKVFAEGMAEVIKHGALGGGSLLDRIARGEDRFALIPENIRIKNSVVSRDERESGPRQILNFGHTFGHALEKLTGYTIYHGEGVAVGMLIAAWTAERKGLCEEGVYAELRELLAAEGLPVRTPFTAAQIAESAQNDKKRRGPTLTLVLPRRRGECFLQAVEAERLGEWISCCDGEVTGR